MIRIIAIMLTGVVLGYFFRNLKFTQKTEHSISLTIITMLFILVVSVGSNDAIDSNLNVYGSQAALLAAFGLGGILYALMFQVGISIGSNKNLKELVGALRWKMLIIPVGTVVGTLLFSALASLLLSRWSVFDCMAVGSGFAYYSLSSILITQFKTPSVGLQLATELGTIALLANIFREMMSLLGAPLIRKYFGKLAPISAAGVNSMDVVLPVITHCSGKEMIPIAILHGILIDMSVPFFVSLFCSM